MGIVMSPRTLIAAIVVVASTTLAPIAHADGKNEIRAVTFDESGGTTSVHVRGADAPTFTVYKLERPTRVVIDMPQARLADAVRGHDSAATFSPNTWAVSTIAAQQLDDNGVRVVVTMARPGRYDVKTVGNEVVVMVMPRDAAPKTANPEDLVRAQQQANAAETARAAAQQQADTATATAKQMKADAEAAKKTAAEQVAKAEAAQHAVERANAADLGAAKQAAAQAKKDADAAKQVAATAQADADRARGMAEKAKQEALAEAQSARAEAKTAQAKAASAESELAQVKSEAARVKSAADKRLAEAANAETELAQAKAEAARAKTAAEKKTAAAELALAQAKADAANEHAAAEQARRDAETAKLDTSNAKAEAARARSEALAAKQDAAADKKKAEAARGDAEKMLKDAKAQVASLEKKTASAQDLEDKARAVAAAAQAREEAARESEARAQQDRLAAEAAVKQAKDAQTKVAASERTKAAADAKAAEDRLALARRATEETEAQRRTAEQATKQAKAELDQTKTMLAGVEQQRTAAQSAAADAARARSEALAAADDASRRRTEAERAAADAAKQKKAAELATSDAVQKKTQAERDRADAEAIRTAALEAAKSAQTARDAAETQRKVAERAAQTAMATKSSAEQSVAELTAKRQAAERAAAELEARSKAEAKAQAEIAAAQTRKASDKDLADARAELAKLADQRKQAETDLADRRKAVASQQAEAARLETVASQAKDAAGREEARRQSLAQKRTTEEAELASITAAKADAQKVKAQVRVAEVDKTPKLSKVTAIDFKGDDGNGQVSIAVGDDAKIEVGEITPSHAELIVDNAELAAKLERTLDVSKFGSPVKSVSSFRDRKSPNRVRLVAELAQPATPTIDRDATSIRWHFISGEAIAKRPVKMTNVPSPVVGGFGAASTPVAQQSVTQVPAQGSRRRIYHGAPVDFDFKDAPIADLLRVISDTGHINIVVPESITAKVTVRLKHVPWDQALEVILQSYGLWYRREGIIYRIATQKELDAEDAAEASRREAALKAEVPRTEVITLNYASAEELKPKLENMKSAHGTIEVDQRTNALIVNDVAGNRAEIVKLALSLDTQTPQISIEARIVEARSTFLRQIGIQWGGNAIAGANGGNATGLSFPSSIGITGANSDAATIATGVAAPSDFAVNLPAPTGSGEGGALGFSLGSIGGNFNINLRLSALEDSGTVRIISAPKVTVLNNRQAKISQGVSIPISVVSAAGTNTQFVQADLSLTVTPYVSQRDCAIAMDLLVQKNEPDFVNVGARGDPTILRKEARTYMLVADGETTVLGGIYTRNSGVAYKKIPLLGDIPVLGWLFKNRRENDDRTEILVFITPKITNKGSLPCAK